MRLSLLIATVSAAILAYEVALMRALSVAQWHHFAYMVVSVALLGFGASGTLLALWGERLRRRFERSMGVLALAFMVSIPASFLLARSVPFDIFQLAWDWRQYVYLAAHYLILFVPFLLGATCIGLALTHVAQPPSAVRHSVHSLYFWNLLGSGLGSAGIVGLMFALTPAMLPVGAFALAAVGWSVFQRQWGLAITAPLLCLTMTLVARPEMSVSPYKALSSFRDMGANVVETRNSPLGMVHVLDGPMIRLVPGLSLAFEGEQPRQRAILVDGDSASAIHHLASPKQAEVFDYTTSALPYHLLDKPKTLIIGAGGGGDVLLARYHNCPDITALELNPAVADLMTGSQADFAQCLYQQPGVRLVVAEARGFLARTSEKFDLIQLPLVESFGTAGAGVAALNEGYLYTVEAFRSYLDHLTPNGILCVTRWLRNPVADCDFIRILSTLTEALKRYGEGNVSGNMMAIRGMFTATVIAGARALSPAQLAAAEEFRRRRSFDCVYCPACCPNDPAANEFNRLPQPYHHEAALHIVAGDREGFIRRHPFDISPTTDDRPYHSLTERWRGIRHLREKLGDQWVRYADWGYIVLWATLAQAVALSVLLILLPLVFRGRTRDSPEPSRARRGTWHAALAVFIYFACLGLAYMFIEIVLMQKLSLFLASPIYAAAIVLASFMVFSGLGSLAAGRVFRDARRAASAGVAGILMVGLALWFGMEGLLGRLWGCAFGVRVAAAVLCVGALACFMGMPFPSGLRRVAEGAPKLVPWAWGVNGSASVVGAVLAMVLAVSWGFRVVLLVALALYALAGAAMARMPGER